MYGLSSSRGGPFFFSEAFPTAAWRFAMMGRDRKCLLMPVILPPDAYRWLNNSVLIRMAPGDEDVADQHEGEQAGEG